MTTAEHATVVSEPRAGYHIVTLNRPDKLNSFNVQQHADLRAALDRAEGDKSCRAVILTGAGRGFCAGTGFERPLRHRQIGRDAEPQ